MDCVSLEFLWSSPLRKAPRDTVFIMVHQGCFLTGQVFVHEMFNIYLLELCLDFSFWMDNSSSLGWFVYHKDSPDRQISRCCWIASGSKHPLILSAHLLCYFQEFCSLSTRTHVTFSKGPVSNFRFSAASSFPSLFLPHPVHYWVNICSWSYSQNFDWFLINARGTKQKHVNIFAQSNLFT